MHAAKITAALGNVPVRKLAAAQIEQRLLAPMAQAGAAKTTMIRTRGLLRMALRRATRDHGLARNVAELAEVPAGGQRKSRSMTRAQVAQLLESGMTPWWSAYVHVALMCGLRPGERAGLRWCDVDFAAGTLAVRQAIHEETRPDGSTYLVAGELKTGQSRHTLAMPAAVAAALRAHRTAQAAARLALPAGAYTDHGLVFCGHLGQPLRRCTFRSGFGRVLRHAGLPSFSLREMRHSFVSVLADAGVSIESITDACGHANSRITRTVYRHQIGDVVASAATAWDEMTA